MNNRRGNPRLQLSHRYAAGRLALEIDALGSDGRWLTLAPATADVSGPDGSTESVVLEPVAPGRYRATLAAPAAGIYRASIGERDSRYSLYLANDAERGVDLPADWYLQAIERGRLKPWNRNALEHALAAAARDLPTRGAWLALLLLTLIGLIVLEFRPDLTSKTLRGQAGAADE